MSDPRFSAEVGIVGVNRFDGLWSNEVKQIWPQIYLSEYVLLEWALPFLCLPFFLFLPSPVLWESTVSFSFAERRSYEDHKIRTRQSTVRRFKIKVHFPYLAYFHWWNRRGEKCMIHLTWNPMSGTHINFAKYDGTAIHFCLQGSQISQPVVSLFIEAKRKCYQFPLIFAHLSEEWLQAIYYSFKNKK